MLTNQRKYTFELIPTPERVEQERQRLIRRVRLAYQRMERWEEIHKVRSKELERYMLKYPR